MEDECKLVLLVVALSALRLSEVVCLFLTALSRCYSERVG